MADREKHPRSEVGSLDSGSVLCFDDLRDDWYRANQLLPRIVRRALRGEEKSFKGFPRQWIPLFEYYQLRWTDCVDPPQHIPLVSELSDDELLQFCQSAKRHGTLRTMIESIVALDSTLADFLYIMDNTTQPSAPTSSESVVGPIRLTNWQSYGREEIKDFEIACDAIEPRASTALLLPCSRRRPYDTSRTHSRIVKVLRERAFTMKGVHRVVVTALGVVPEELWRHPVVLKYDAGVPDIYRVLRLARRYFRRNQYESVIDCLEFQPYSDVIEILHREMTIKRIIKGPVRRSRQFYVRS